MPIELKIHELSKKESQVSDPPLEPKPKIIDFKVERLKRTNPELFDPSLFYNNAPWDLAEYRKRKEFMAQADAVLALAVGFSLPFEEKIRFIARMHGITLIGRTHRKKIRLIK